MDATMILGPAVGEVTALKRAIAQGADVNESKDDWFPLMMAVAVNQTEAVEVLLKHGARADQGDLNGLTSLALAVQEGHVGPLGVLLKHGADVNLANENGVTPLMYAAQLGHAVAVDVLLEYSADVNVARKGSRTAPLHAAVRCGSPAVVARLLDARADPNVLDATGESPLLAAIRASPPLTQTRVVGHHHHHKGKSAKRQDAATPLKRAGPPGGALKEALVAILLGGGADVNLAGGSETTLGASVRCGGVGLVRRLLEAGADATVADPRGATPLFVASCATSANRLRQQVDLADLLLAHGAPVDAADMFGTTPLHAAVYFGRAGLVDLLVEHGANVDAAVVVSQDAQLPEAEEKDEFAASPCNYSSVQHPLVPTTKLLSPSPPCALLRLPPGFTPIRLATAATRVDANAVAAVEEGDGAEEPVHHHHHNNNIIININNNHNHHNHHRAFPTAPSEEAVDGVRRRIADALWTAGAIEALDATTLQSAEDVERWVRALSWHSRSATEEIASRLRDRSCRGEGLFDLSEEAWVEVVDFLDQDDALYYSSSESLLNASSSQLSTATKATASTARTAARLWHRKAQRHAALQRDRDEREHVLMLRCDAVDSDDPAVSHLANGDFDNAEARDDVVRHLRQAAALYTLNTTASTAAAAPSSMKKKNDGGEPRPEDIGGPQSSSSMEDVASALRSAVEVCRAEEARFARCRASCVEDRYTTMAQRWASLEAASAAVAATVPGVARQPGPSGVEAWWGRAPEKCPWFLARTATEAKLHHLRVRAAAARPILCGILTELCDEVNRAPAPSTLGLSGTTFFLPFAEDTFCAVDGPPDDPRRCKLVSKPTLAFDRLWARAKALLQTAQTTTATTSDHSSMDHRHHDHHHEEEEASSSSDVVVVVSDVVRATVEVEDPYVAAVVLALVAQRAQQGDVPLKVAAVADASADRARSLTLRCTVTYPRDAEEHARLASAANDLADQEKVTNGNPRRSLRRPETRTTTTTTTPKESTSSSEDDEHHAPVSSSFNPGLAGQDLLCCEVEVCFGRLAAIDRLESPFLDVTTAPDPGKHLFSNPIPFVDPETWQVAVPPDVLAFQRRKRHHTTRRRTTTTRAHDHDYDHDDDDDDDHPPASDENHDAALEDIAALEEELAATQDALDVQKQIVRGSKRVVSGINTELKEARAELDDARAELEDQAAEIERLHQLLADRHVSDDGAAPADDADEDLHNPAAVRPGDLPATTKLPHIVAQPPATGKPTPAAPPKKHRRVAPEAPSSDPVRYA